MSLNWLHQKLLSTLIGLLLAKEMLKKLLQFHSETDGEENASLMKSDRKLHQKTFLFKVLQEVEKHKSLVVSLN